MASINYKNTRYQGNTRYAKLNTKGLQTLAKNLDKNMMAGLLRLGESIAKEAQNLAPKDTGALAESIHVTARFYSDHEVAMGNAQEQFEQAKLVGYTPKGRPVLKNAQFQGREEVAPDRDDQVWVVVGMNYGLFVEMGTVHMGAQPFLAPAVLHHEEKVAKFLGGAITVDMGVSTNG